MALQAELEFGDSSNPTFHRYEEPWVQWGGPNPDNVYARAAIDPAATYRVFGNVTGVRTALFSLVDGDMHLDRYGVFSERTLADLDVAPDGSFELWISPDRHEHNWIASHADARLLPRPAVPLRLGARPVGATHASSASTPAGSRPTRRRRRHFTDALERAATWTERSMEYWCAYVEKARSASPATRSRRPPRREAGRRRSPTARAGGSSTAATRCSSRPMFPTPTTGAGPRTIAIRLDSGDFANRQTSLNMVQTAVDDDARVRIVVADDDPGVPNWIDTEHQPEGMLTYRSIGTRSRPTLEARVVPLAELREHVPPVMSGDRPSPSAASSWRAGVRRCSPATSRSWPGRRGRARNGSAS